MTNNKSNQVCFVCLLIEIKSIILRDDNDYHHVCKIAIEEKFFKNPEVHVGIVCLYVCV